MAVRDLGYREPTPTNKVVYKWVVAFVEIFFEKSFPVVAILYQLVFEEIDKRSLISTIPVSQRALLGEE
jgi:hypothetical protein